MRRDIGTIVVGLLFLLAGIAVGGSMLGFFDFTINFAGWWTLFLIVPALIAIAQGGINAGNIILLGIGVVLLLDQQRVLPDGFTWRLILPLILLAIGVQLIFGGRFHDDWHWRHADKTDADGTRYAGSSDASGSATGSTAGSSGFTKGKDGGVFTEKSRPGNSFKTASVLFGGQDIIYGQEDFTGGAYTAIFGGLTINMRSVRLVGDVVINVTAVFGSVDIIVPDNVQLVSNVIPILGGVDNKYASSHDATAPKIIINGNTVFGGLEIR